jgi:hypothetical protein
MNQMTMAASALAALAVAVASPSHADANIAEIINGSGDITCGRLSRQLTGDPANDLTVFMNIGEGLASFYAISLHDASTATGRIIATRCPQYEPNILAAGQYAKDHDG